MMKYIIGIPLVFLACFVTEYIADTLSERLNCRFSEVISILFAVVAVAAILFFEYKFGIYGEW